MRRPTFRELINSVAPQDISLEKQDGTTRVGFKAYSIFEPHMIIVPYKNVDMGINVGDIITRYTPSGSERLVVIEPGHHIAFNPEQTDGYPEHFRIIYRREAEQDKRMGDMVTISSNQLKKKHTDGTYLVAGIGKVQIPDELQAAANELGGSVAYLCADGSAAKDTIPFYRAVSVVPGEDEETIMDSTIPDQKPLHPNSVFVIHGRNTHIKKQIELFLRAIGIKPLEWEQARKLTGKPNPYTWELVDAALREASVIIVLFTPDDEAKLRQEYVSEHDEDFESVLTPQPRPNVLFEAGVAFGRNSQRTLIVSAGKIRPISDLTGHHVLRLNNSPKCRMDFAERLADAGCIVDKSGTDWLEAGNFDMPTAQKTKSGVGNEPPIAHQVSAPKISSGNFLFQDILNSLPSLNQEPPAPLPNSNEADWKDIDNALVEVKNMMVSRATGGNCDDDRYRSLRNFLLEFEDVTPLLPPYLVNSRTVGEFWDYIKNRAAKYEERRRILQDDFAGVLSFVESNVRQRGKA